MSERHDQPSAAPSQGARAPAGLDPFELPLDPVSRRRFLTLLGASAALAAGAGCSRVDRGSVIPAARKVPGSAPGVARAYASAFQDGWDSFGVLVHTREGRPIHITGNDLDPTVQGKAPLTAIADVLRLYDPDRLRQPSIDGQPASWITAFERVERVLRAARAERRPVLLLTGATTSPTRRALLAEVQRALPSLDLVRWDPCASEAEQAAWLACHGVPAARPRYDRARVVLTLDADPLGSGAPDAIDAFARLRRPADARAPMARLWAIEGGLSVTGAKADHRLALAPSSIAGVAFALARLLHERGLPLPRGVTAGMLTAFDLQRVADETHVARAWIEALAVDLHAARGASLVLVGAAQSVSAHVAGHLLNALLGSEAAAQARVLAGDALDTTAVLRQRLERMAGGEYAAALFWDTNPAHAFPDADLVRRALARTPASIAIGMHRDETASLCGTALAASHWLESWGDQQPAPDVQTLQQPGLAPLFDTRSGDDILIELLRRLGEPAPASYAEYVQQRWRRDLHAARTPVPFGRFWHAALHDGLIRRSAAGAALPAFKADAVRDAVRSAATGPLMAGVFELVPTVGWMRDGRHANNGWLQELPDPVTRATWGNALSVSPDDARQLGVRGGDVLRVAAEGRALEAPALVQAGQASGVVTLATGYGRQTGSVASGVGANVFALLNGGGLGVTRVTLAKTGARMELALTQTHHRLEGRDLARSLTRAELAAGGHPPEPAGPPASLYPDQPRAEHKWGMVIDLSSCVGCAGCVVACQSENNIPVVGPEQVRKGRAMHWLRIDRYYEGEGRELRVVNQPMLCQHCDHAPCETVCPVNATNHSPEGLNQMAYNRCVGTRYCANNCPYKVRRFNFLDFTGAKREPETFVFNPEVTVRPRGVMEKCTFCVQRIEEGRARSKAEGRSMRDGDVTPACAVACPAQAIVFGDLNDSDSRVARLARDGRGYHVLSELGTRPAVTYLAEIRNPAGALAGTKPTKQGGEHGA